MVLCLGGPYGPSDERVRRALVDAGAAVDALSAVDDGDVLYDYGVLRADVGAGTARNAVLGNYLRHSITVRPESARFGTEQKKEGRRALKGPVFASVSVLDGLGGALVDAGAAVDALSAVDDGDVVDGDCTLGADVGAGTARNAVLSNYFRHVSHLDSTNLFGVFRHCPQLNGTKFGFPT